MELWKKVGIVVILIFIGLFALAWITSQPQEEKCLVWQRVDERIYQKGLQSTNYNLALNESNILIPVYTDTYDWVKVGQSYDFYCSKYLFRDWICSASYECNEMHWST